MTVFEASHACFSKSCACASGLASADTTHQERFADRNLELHLISI
jgi:hypothetical protein